MLLLSKPGGTRQAQPEQSPCIGDPYPASAARAGALIVGTGPPVSSPTRTGPSDSAGTTIGESGPMRPSACGEHRRASRTGASTAGPAGRVPAPQGQHDWCQHRRASRTGASTAGQGQQDGCQHRRASRTGASTAGPAGRVSAGRVSSADRRMQSRASSTVSPLAARFSVPPQQFGNHLCGHFR